MDQHRAHPRHTARLKLKIAFPDANELQTVYTKNISKGGMFLATPNPLGPGTRVVVRLWPPGVQSPFDLEGEVAHSVDTPEAIRTKCTPGMGIKFTNLTPTRKAALDQYIKDVLAGRVPAEPPERKPLEAARPPATPARPAATAHPPRTPPSGGTMPLPHPSAVAPRPEAFLREVDAAYRRLRNKNHYEFLEVEPTASQAELKRAYNRLALRYHPDRAPVGLRPDERSLVASLFAEIGELIERLTDPAGRVRYDLSHSIERAPENEEERLALLQERTRFREAFVQRFPERIQQAARFAEMASVALAQGDKRGALNNFKLALQLDPMNEELRTRVASLAPR